MVHIISIVNQKGGVGKTTTAINLSSCLAQANHSTILVDLDPQGNATSGIGLEKHSLDLTLYDSLIEEIPFHKILQRSSMKNLLVAPSNSDLLSAEWHLASSESGKTALRKELSKYLWNAELEDRPDFIIIDCPPSLGQLSLNAILASDSLIIPVQCEYYALEGLAEILASTTLLRQNFNPELDLCGILLTMADKRLNLSRQVEEDIRKVYKNNVFQSIIYRSVRLSEAPSFGLPIIQYDPDSTGATAYKELTEEVINHETKSPRSWPLRSSVGNTG